MWWVYKIMLMPISLMLVLMFPGHHRETPVLAPAMYAHAFPLEIFDYPPMIVSSRMIEPRMMDIPPTLYFRAFKDITCKIADDSLDGDVQCSGYNNDLIPLDMYVSKINNTEDKKSWDCLDFSVETAENNYRKDAFTINEVKGKCEGGDNEVNILTAHHKVVFAGTICGITDNQVLACAGFNKHGFVLIPHHQSWAY